MSWRGQGSSEVGRLKVFLLGGEVKSDGSGGWSHVVEDLEVVSDDNITVRW